ncbi:hypothetical protein WJX72_010421 [[Myrmecia] bisecta]|uniref:Plastid division regulator MinE n=1 Tax=[Myrmecia] bisecta TaxID=41462 RepID=A0AAW1PX44_9CHLO
MAAQLQCSSLGRFAGRPAARLQGGAPCRPCRAGRIAKLAVASYTEAQEKEAQAADMTKLISSVRQKTAAKSSRPVQPTGPVSNFAAKLRAAWQIFFPAPAPKLSPKEEGKHRLRMILVADRCGMNQTSLYEMKHQIVRAVSEYVDIEGEDLVEVNITTDPDMGTIYSVAMPVKRVKPQARLELAAAADADGVSLEWDAEDPESDPSGQFPFGC